MPHLRQGQRQRGDEDSHGRSRDATESGLLRLVDVETGQTDGGKHRQQERHTGQQVDAVQGETRQVEGVVHHVTHDEAWRHAERDYVGQRVQVATDRRMGVKKPGKKTVEEIKNTGHENHKSSLDGHARGDKQDGKTTRQQVAAGDDVGNVLLDVHWRWF